MQQGDLLPLAQGLWIVAQPFRLLGAELGNRMTIIRLSDGGLLLHSPVAANAALLEAVAQCGPVRFIIIPNRFHGLHVNDWLEAFPAARFLAVDGVRSTSKHKSERLTLDSMRSCQPDIETLAVGGMSKLNEFLFFHPPSQTLIMTDLCFNIGTEISAWSKLFFKLNGAYATFGPSRLMKSMIDDKSELAISIKTLLEWDFKRVIVSHGQIVEQNARQLVKDAFAEYLIAAVKKKRSVFGLPLRCG